MNAVSINKATAMIVIMETRKKKPDSNPAASLSKKTPFFWNSDNGSAIALIVKSGKAETGGD